MERGQLRAKKPLVYIATFLMSEMLKWSTIEPLHYKNRACFATSLQVICLIFAVKYFTFHR
jgi:hypothetical protein